MQLSSTARENATTEEKMAFSLEQFSIERRETKTKVITPTNPKNQSEFEAGKRVRETHGFAWLLIG